MDDNDIVYEDFSDFLERGKIQEKRKIERRKRFKGILKPHIPIDVYSLDGKLLGSYDSIKEAARELEISESTIRKNLDLNRKAGDKLFVLKGESFEDKKKAMETHRYIDGRRKIIRSSLGIKEYTINGTFVTYWSTPLEAAKAYGLRAHDISRCLKGERLTVGGKIFLPSLEPISKRLNRIKKKKK